MSCVSREIRTRQCCFTVFTIFRCDCHNSHFQLRQVKSFEWRTFCSWVLVLSPASLTGKACLHPPCLGCLYLPPFNGGFEDYVLGPFVINVAVTGMSYCRLKQSMIPQFVFMAVVVWCAEVCIRLCPSTDLRLDQVEISRRASTTSSTASSTAPETWPPARSLSPFTVSLYT